MQSQLQIPIIREDRTLHQLTKGEFRCQNWGGSGGVGVCRILTYSMQKGAQRASSPAFLLCTVANRDPMKVRKLSLISLKQLPGPHPSCPRACNFIEEFGIMFSGGIYFPISKEEIRLVNVFCIDIFQFLLECPGNNCPVFSQAIETWSAKI